MSKSSFWNDLKYIKDNWNSPGRRPVWQIVLMFPLWLIYTPCLKFVNWMDN